MVHAGRVRRVSVTSYDDKALSHPGRVMMPVGLLRLGIVLASAAVSFGTFYMLWKGLSRLGG